ncbi:MAG: 4Fe-4S binding protein [Limnochordia bacterium]
MVKDKNTSATQEAWHEDRSTFGNQGWREIKELGGTIQGGANAPRFETGDWRTLKPIHLPERCIHCLLCWVYCPDMAVIVEDGRMVGFDYKHCKGCGICAKECPSRANAIDMIPEDADPSMAGSGGPSEYEGRSS